MTTRTLVAVLLTVLFLGFAPHTMATPITITFDNLSDSGAGTPIVNGYEGLNWTNFVVLNTPDYPQTSGYQAGTVSPPNVAYGFNADDGSTPSFSSTTQFTLTSAYFTGAWNNGLNITITGFSGASQVDQKTIVVSSTAPTLETFDWTGLTQVDFKSSGGTHNPSYLAFGHQFALDNLTVDLTPTPEPTSILLFGTGLLGIGFIMRKRLFAYGQ